MSDQTETPEPKHHENFIGKLEAPTPWSRLDINQQIERMRQIIKAQGDQLNYQNGRLWALQRQLREHRHVGDVLMVPLNEVGLGQGIEAKLQPDIPGEEYF